MFYTYPFAFIESKKQGGKPNIPNKMLKNYINRYKQFIIRELRILNPNMIVCTSPIIYGFVCGLYPKNELMKIEGHNSIRIHQESGTLIFCSYHPSARKGYAEIYAGVMNHYMAFLLSEYAGENGLIK